MRRLAVALLAILALAACGDGGNTGPEAQPQVDGVWISPDPAGALTDLSFDLEESSDGSVSGEWAGEEGLGGGGLTQRVTGQISGSHSHPNVTLTLFRDGSEEAIYTATLETRDLMEGTWAFSPDSRYDITFQR